MNATLPDVFDLSSLSRALDEVIAAQEHAAIDYVPMDVDDEWTPPPVLHMDNAPRPWYNPEPQPAWNNLELELEDPPVEDASQDVPGWYVNLRGPNDQPRPIWRNLLPVVSVRRVENAHVPDRAPAPSVPAPRPWYNPEPQPAWNNLEFELENPPVENASQVQIQDVPGPSVNLRGQKDQSHSTGRYLPVVSVRRIEKARVRKALTPAPTVPMVLDRKEQKTRAPAVPSLATKAEKARVFGVPGSAIKVEKVHERVAPSPARRAGKARVPGISVSTRKALGVLASVRNTCVPDVPASARKAEKSRAPSTPTPSPQVPVPSKSISTRSKPVVPPRIDFANMSSSSKVKLEDMPKVDEHPVPMCISWPTPAYIIQLGPPKATTSYHHRKSPITHTHQAPADEDVVMIENDYIDIDPTISVPTTKDEDTTSDDTHVAHLTEPLQPVVHHAEEGEPTVDRICNATPEDDVGTGDAKEEDSTPAENTDEDGEEKSEETEEETEEERQARVARLMTEVFGDGEDSDDEEPPSAKDTAVSLDHPSTSAASDALTVDATESITDWSLDTPDDAGIEDNGTVVVADRDDEDEESQFNYRAQLLAEIFGDDEEDGQIVQEAPLVSVPVPATRDLRKRKREDDGPSPMPCLVTMDPRKRKREDDGPSPMPCLVTTDPRKRKREDDGPSPMPCLVTMDPRKRKREDDGRSPMPRLVTTDPRKRKREDDGPSPMSCLVTMDPRKRKRDDGTPPTPTLVTRDPRKRRREDELRPAAYLVTRDPRKRFKG